MARVAAVAAAVAMLALSPPAGAQQVTEADCEAAVKATAAAYESGEKPDKKIEAMARECTTVTGGGPIEGEVVEESPDSESLDGTTAALFPTQCKTINAGYYYTNGFGQVIAYFYGNLRWCYNGNKVQGGDFWISVDRCCNWFYEGVVHSRNSGGFGCECSHVYRHRIGSFIFNPPWPTITTRLQPWFELYGDKNGGWWARRGG